MSDIGTPYSDREKEIIATVVAALRGFTDFQFSVENEMAEFWPPGRSRLADPDNVIVGRKITLRAFGPNDPSAPGKPDD